jgi:hypothetical protein
MLNVTTKKEVHLAKMDDIKSFTSYFPHVLFTIAQILCGTFFILMIVPPIIYLISSDFSFLNILNTYPNFWGRLLSALTISDMLVWIGLSFSIGICIVEFFYRIGRWIGYINDLNLENNNRDATEDEQIDLFIQKCHLQRCPWLSRIWEWENFQSNLFFYAESISFLLFLFLGLSILFTFLQTVNIPGQIRPLICTLVLWIITGIIFLAMRKARKGKYESFRLAHKAVKKLLKEQIKLEENENIKAQNTDSSPTS